MTLRNWPQRIRQRADRAVRILRSPINPRVTDHDGHRNSAVVTWRSDFATFSRYDDVGVSDGGVQEEGRPWRY